VHLIQIPKHIDI